MGAGVFGLRGRCGRGRRHFRASKKQKSDVHAGQGGGRKPEKGKGRITASYVRVVQKDLAEFPFPALGLKAALSCLSQARYGIAWGVLGAAEACYQCALDYALNRIQFDRPIASFQLQQEKLAWMVTELTKGQLLAFQLGTLKERGTVTPASGSPGTFR